MRLAGRSVLPMCIVRGQDVAFGRMRLTVVQTLQAPPARFLGQLGFLRFAFVAHAVLFNDAARKPPAKTPGCLTVEHDTRIMRRLRTYGYK